MFVEERHNVIIELLEKDGRIKVKELSTHFNLTEDAIRKDLSILEKKGLLKRVYGGAVKTRDNKTILLAKERVNIFPEAKHKIAEKAISLIEENTTIFLDISTINMEIAKLLNLSNKKITVVTNMIDILLELRGSKNISLLFIGGELTSDNEDGFIGALAIEQVKNFYFDCCFMGTSGINLNNNIVSTYFLNDSLMKKNILKNSRYKYLVSELEKFNHDSRFSYSTCQEFDLFILDSIPDKENLRLLQELKIKFL